MITVAWKRRWGGDQPGLWDSGPQHGSLPLGPTVVLCSGLGQHTSTPTRCFFGVSYIYDDLPDHVRTARQVLGAYVVTGPLLALADNSFKGPPTLEYRSANLSWPEDRAWFLQSTYDLQETFIGGSAACVESLVANSALEAMRIDPGQRLVDHLNPEPAGEYRG